MDHTRRTAMSGIAPVMVAALALAAGAAPATAREPRGSHPPIFVATPSKPSLITPYYYPYGGGYRYNSPGPVYYHLPYWGPSDGCRLWRYNYLYWVC